MVSNSSFNNLKFPYLRNIFDKSLNIPSYYSFRSKLLHDVLDKLYFAIENKLKEAVSVSLILDLWTNNFNTDFMPCAAMLSFKTIEKESLVLGMTPMPCRHTSANINKALLKLLQIYNFNRKKIYGNNYLIINFT